MSAAVRAAVALAMPTPASTLALRAALWPGDEGHAAFLAWAEATGDPQALPPELRQPLRELGPQLDVARRRHGVEPSDRTLATLLRAAGDRERRRWPVYVQSVRDLVAGEDLPLVSGGLATSLAAYDEPGVRHSHDLERLGPVAGAGDHPSGLPWATHVGRLPVRWGVDDDLEELRARAVPDDRLGPTLLRLGVGDLLVVVLVHALATRNRTSARWASDGHLLSAAATAGDWAVLTRSVADARLSSVVHPALTYLRDELRSEVPDRVLADLEAGPAPDRVHEEIALAWALEARERRPELGSRDGRAAVLALARWGAWPSSAYLATTDPRRSRLGRLVNWVRGRAVGIVRRSGVVNRR
jgi:hypothetical protein